MIRRASYSLWIVALVVACAGFNARVDASAPLAATAAALLLDTAVDDGMERLVQAHPWLVGVGELLEDAGGPYGIGAATAALWLADYQAGTKAIKAVTVTAAATYLLKAAIGRNRPVTRSAKVSLQVNGSDSFLSGHSSMAFALATVAAEAFPESKGTVYAAAAAIALSRVVIGRHWLSDVVAGAWLGHWIASALVGKEAPIWVWEW